MGFLFFVYALFLSSCNNSTSPEKKTEIILRSDTVKARSLVIDSLINIQLDQSGLLTWQIINENPNVIFEIEDCRWNTWTTIGYVEGKTGTSSYKYLIDTICGLYSVRIKVLDGKTSYSKTVNYPNPRDIYFLTVGCGSTRLTFNTKTKFEICDTLGKTLISDCSDVVDYGKLKRGVYFINFGNRTGEFIRK